MSGWHVNTGVIARCHPALDRDAMQRGEAGIHTALQYEISKGVSGTAQNFKMLARALSLLVLSQLKIY